MPQFTPTNRPYRNLLDHTHNGHPPSRDRLASRVDTYVALIDALITAMCIGCTSSAELYGRMAARVALDSAEPSNRRTYRDIAEHDTWMAMARRYSVTVRTRL